MRRREIDLQNAIEGTIKTNVKGLLGFLLKGLLARLVKALLDMLLGEGWVVLPPEDEI